MRAFPSLSLRLPVQAQVLPQVQVQVLLQAHEQELLQEQVPYHA